MLSMVQRMGNLSWVRGFVKTCFATVVYAGVHSLFASRRAKAAVNKFAGPRARNGLYRPFYLVQSVATIAVLIRYVKRQPAKMLFAFRGPASIPFRMVQAAGLCWAFAAAYEVGYLEILGVRPLADLIFGVRVFPPEPEAQGPALFEHGLRIRGPFRVTRHPLNLAPLPVMWFNPRMTTNLLAFNIVSTIYLVIGSKHEERRLLMAYGEPYRRYQRTRVPFYLPVVRKYAVASGRNKSQAITMQNTV